MRKGAFLVLPLAVCLSIAAGGGQAQTGAGNADGKGDQKPSLFSRFPGLSGKKTATDPALTDESKNDKTKPGSKAGKSPSANQSDYAAQLLKDEQANYLRREAVCDKLRDIARETDDDKLLRLADELNDMAWDLYRKRTAAIAIGLGEAGAGEKQGKSGLKAAGKDKQ